MTLLPLGCQPLDELLGGGLESASSPESTEKQDLEKQIFVCRQHGNVSARKKR